MTFFLTSSAPLTALALFLLGSFGALLIERIAPAKEMLAGRLAHLAALAGSLIMGCTAFMVLSTGQGISFGFASALPFIEFAFRFDAFAAYFVILASLVGSAVSVYGLGYQQHFLGKHSLGWYGCLYALFLGSLFVLPLTNHAFFFLFVWEIMSLASYFLVIYERNAESERAGFLYFLMTHLGTAFIMLALFLAYSQTGSLSFDDWRTASFGITPWFKGIIFLSAIIGFGTKAGIIPLHIWLPEAHPAAPSPVSALMSGVMVKVAFFMLVRFFFDLFPGATMEWGLGIMVLGGFSALLGILYALAEKDLKRLLAYSTVENMGIMFLGLGSAIVFFALGAQSFALFALAAALYHALNHAIFKSLLFLGAGTVVSAAGTRNMDAYGGLIRALPYTAGFFLVGSLAISAFPPFNGFASEWLTYQALFVGVSSPDLLVKGIFIAAIVALVFTSGLAAATFVKAFGGTFLGRPRTALASVPHEAGKLMLVAMGFLALLALVLGIGATFVIASLVAVIASFGLTDPALLRFPFAEFVAARAEFANVLPLGEIAFLAVLVFVLASAIIYWFTRKRLIVVGETWDCGMPLGPRTQISATGFSRSLITIFRGVLRPTKQKSIEYQDGRMRYFIKHQEIKTEIADLYRKGIYHPANVLLLFVARQAKRIQNGSVNAYVLYIFLTLLVLLFWASHSS